MRKQRLTVLLSLLMLIATGGRAEEKLETEGNPSDQFVQNFKFASLILTRRGWGIKAPKRFPVSLGVDLSLVRIPPNVISAPIAEVTKKFLFLPLPQISIDTSSSGNSISSNFMMISSSPADGTKVSYLTGQLGFSTFMNSSRSWAVTVDGLVSVLNGTRDFKIDEVDVSQEIGLIGTGGELTFIYTGKVDYSSSERSANFMVPKFGIGGSTIKSRFVSEEIETVVEMQTTVIYFTLGVGFCSSERLTCLVTEINNDKDLGNVIVNTLSLRI